MTRTINRIAPAGRGEPASPFEPLSSGDFSWKQTNQQRRYGRKKAKTHHDLVLEATTKNNGHAKMMRRRILDLYSRGKSYAYIAVDTRLPMSVVSEVIKLFGGVNE